MSILSALERICATSRMGTPLPPPTLTANPSSLSVSAASRFARAMSSTNEKSRAENRDHASIGIENGLARSVSARVTKRNRRDPNLFAPKQDKLLLINFGQTVNGFAANRRVLGSGRAFRDRPTDGTVDFPVAFTQLLDRSHRWKDETMPLANARAFAVNSLRARHDNFLHWQTLLADYFEHLRGA